ncbi:outer membrane beta-barrel protein [uncultured Parasphingorhabdus sp.]|uniref:outer membrane protein n=1 Tax=uncultured Parasphingorhabdus sp. TaxID=2709694 RepID=UPI0030DCE299|tara:strand:- start:33937 stop:34773 length:837 start_codon:yes stop_codon:yes gene_type:complete
MSPTKRALSVATVLTAMIAVPAQAQEIDNKEFDGFYVGGSFGLGAQSNDRDEGVTFDTDRDGSFDNVVRTVSGADAFSPGFCNGAANGNAPTAGCRNDKDDMDYYIRAGADKQYGNFVVGFLVDAGRSESTDSVTAFSTTPASYTFTRQLDYALGARGRVGYTPGGVLFYATGGVSYAKIDNSFTTTNGANSFTDNGKTESFGWTAGGGAEAKVTNNITMGLEYLYTQYTDDDYVVNVGPGTAGATNPFLLASGGTDMKRSDPNFDQHSIRLTAALRF